MAKNNNQLEILVIEDNPADMELLKLHVGNTRFNNSNIHSCDSIKMVTQSLEKTTYHIALLDIGLLDSIGTSGLETILAIDPNLPVIILTGNSNHDLGPEAIKKGAQDYLFKNEVTPAVLEKSIWYATERMAYKNQISASEAKYSSLINTMKEALLQVDEKENILFVNNNFCELLGYNKDEVLGKNAVALLNYLEDEDFVYNKQQLRQKGIADKYEIRLRTKNNDFIWALVSASPVIENGQLIGSMGVITDITKQKKLIGNLKEREEKLQLIYDNAQVGIARVDYFSHQILQCNNYLVKLLGYNKGSALNEVNFEKIVASECKEKIAKSLSKMKHAEATNISLVVKLCTRSNQLIDTELSLTKVMPQNKPAYFVAVLKDITELKKAERKLAANAEMLLQFNNELQGLLNAQRKTESELRAKNDELDTFVYKASHDLKGPLASIKGLINLGLAEENGSENELMHKIAESTDRLDNILNDLLCVSRASLSKLKLTKVNCSDIVAKVVESLRYSDYASGVEIRINIKKDDYKINSNKELLFSILQNLIFNSIKYKDENKPKQYVKIKVSREGKFVQFTVEDNGVGIPDQYKEKVLDMFFRANESSSGSGLGLYIVKKNVEKLNGKLKLYDNPQGGTIVDILIPI